MDGHIFVCDEAFYFCSCSTMSITVTLRFFVAIARTHIYTTLTQTHARIHCTDADVDVLEVNARGVASGPGFVLREEILPSAQDTGYCDFAYLPCHGLLDFLQCVRAC